jgi:hypothetical protein
MGGGRAWLEFQRVWVEQAGLGEGLVIGGGKDSGKKLNKIVIAIFIYLCLSLNSIRIKILTAIFGHSIRSKKRHNGQLWPCVTFFGPLKSPFFMYDSKKKAQP